MEVDLTEVGKMNFDVDEVIEKMKNATIEKKTETFVCDDCGGGFSSQGYLDHHKEKKHGEILKPFLC